MPKYESLVHLMNGLTAGKNLDARARRGSYWRNMVKVFTDSGRGRYAGSGLLLSRDGHFVTNHHVLNEEIARRECAIFIPEVDLKFPLSKILITSKLHDLVLAKASLSTISVPTEVILSDYRPSFKDRVRTYGYKHEVVEERVGAICLNASSRFGDGYWQAGGTKSIKYGLEDVALRNTFYSTCDVELGWSGGPVVLESSGELLGFTKMMVHSPDSWLSLAPPKQHGFTGVKKLKEMIDYFLNKPE